MDPRVQREPPERIRFGFLTVAGGQTSPNAGNNFAAQTGLQGVTTNPLDLGYPQISFGGQFTTMGDPALFTFRNNRDFEFYDNVIWHKGTHTIKFGGYAMHYDLRPVNPNGARGIFSFTPRWTSSAPGLANGNAFADFLLGYPTTAQVGLGRAAMDASTNWGHFYIQDNWQITPNLKVDFGIRYEYNQNMTDANNQIAAIDTSVQVAGSWSRATVPGTFHRRRMLCFRSFRFPTSPLPPRVGTTACSCRGRCALRPAQGLPGVFPEIENRNSRRRRYLPQSGRLQHRYEPRAEPAVLRDQNRQLGGDALAVFHDRKRFDDE